VLFPVLLSAKVASGCSDYQTQLQGAFVDLNVTSWGHIFATCMVRKGEGSKSLLHNRPLPCSMLWLLGSWGKVTGTSGGCLQTAGWLPRGFRQCSHLGFSVSLPISLSSALLQEAAEDARGDSRHRGPEQDDIM